MRRHAISKKNIFGKVKASEALEAAVAASDAVHGAISYMSKTVAAETRVYAAAAHARAIAADAAASGAADNADATLADLRGDADAAAKMEYTNAAHDAARQAMPEKDRTEAVANNAIDEALAAHDRLQEVSDASDAAHNAVDTENPDADACIKSARIDAEYAALLNNDAAAWAHAARAWAGAAVAQANVVHTYDDGAITQTSAEQEQDQDRRDVTAVQGGAE